jgi:hypothetical protein
MSLDSLSEGLLMKSFDRLIPSAAAQCLECPSLSLMTYGEIEDVGSGLRNVLDRSLVKASACSLP